MTETYSLANDFGGSLHASALDQTIDQSAITTSLIGITIEDDVVSIEFESAISPADKITLDNLITNFTSPERIREETYIYDAIVDAKGTGDYTSLSAAINSGAITIFMRQGIYVETSDIILPNNFDIHGEDKTSVIITFAGTPSGFVASAGNPIESTGTVSCTHSETTVTGVGTTFTNLVPYDYIELGRSVHQIVSIESDTSLTLRYPLRGPSVTNAPFRASTMFTGTLSNMSIAMSAGSLLTLDRTINISINNIGFGLANKAIHVYDSAQYSMSTCVIHNCTTGIHAERSAQLNFTQSILKNNGLYGLLIDNCYNIVVDGINITSTAGDGLHVTSGENVQIMDTASYYNNGNGLMSSTGNINIQSCTFSNNGGHGISTNSGVYSIGGCTILDNIQNGIHLTNDNGVVFGSSIQGNANGIEFGDNADNYSVTGCMISNNTNGIELGTNSSDMIISACHVINNTNNGIHIDGSDNIITGCNVKNNTNANIVDNGSNTLQSTTFS